MAKEKYDPKKVNNDKKIGEIGNKKHGKNVTAAVIAQTINKIEEGAAERE